MKEAVRRAHPFMPNSVDSIKQELLQELGIDSVEALFEQIPASHRVAGTFNFPPTLSAEVELNRHISTLLAKNQSCESHLSFLGGGCWQHYVPAVCQEIMSRSEFLTPVWGTPSSDHGRNQVWFEFNSQLGELIAADMVGMPVYSWGCATGHAIRMASRLTGRHKVLLPRILDPERRAVIANYCEPEEMPSHIAMVDIASDPATGALDLADLKKHLDESVAAVYLETPNYLGIIETQAEEIAAMARAAGAETIVGVDPLSLGILKAPGDYGADIIVGSTQPMGVPMSCGGGLGGFIASRDEPRYAHEYPTLMLSIADTAREGEVGFSMALMHQSSYGSREDGKDWTGNSTYLHAIAGAVYLSLLGPEGMRELGELIIQRAHYAAQRLNTVEGISVPRQQGFFKEFVVNFDGVGKSVAEINAALLERGIFGGIDLTETFPELGRSALYCVTELHTQTDIDHLANTLQEVCS
ncbi:aminomethyl-transferring glycine dehydrogenase subunit GcvPA [Chromatocurvus halotolerans]|uniref:Glycine dehydrogenase subunit 1 n=1 Tax=Chromatocurvus halotolerans TaxID=1132028 RepID=A0A4R2L0B5_9GAMM|nr:aminomethyl-transferring glycine dehydrogenase subunit GcvPA [Chromatocurvus halotolerans]TCO77116.1 glycine dehydrogenase subunit 1 [Chromatocurvus halotolerans]